jgi:hypothetical protein
VQGFSNVCVEWDDGRTSGPCSGGYETGCNTDQLEPLTPPHESGDWAVIDALLPNLRERVQESETVAFLALETVLLSERRL